MTTTTTTMLMMMDDYDDDDDYVCGMCVWVIARAPVRGVWRGPVSYTHLDVYKRQAQRSKTVNRF